MLLRCCPVLLANMVVISAVLLAEGGLRESMPTHVKEAATLSSVRFAKCVKIEYITNEGIFQNVSSLDDGGL
jgi:hypothetical protein